MKWGDVDCDANLSAVDALKLLWLLVEFPIVYVDPCPKLRISVEWRVLLGGASSEEGPTILLVWGDLDCDGDVDAVDALQALRDVAGLTVFQEDGCPEIGSLGLIEF